MFQLLITSGILVTSIAGLINVFTSIMSNKTLKRIELKKHSNTLKEYRYIELYKVLQDICSLVPIEFDISEENLKKTVTDVTDRYSVINNKYLQVKPLIEEKYLMEVEETKHHEQHLSNLMVSNIYESKGGNAHLLVDIMGARIKFNEQVIGCINQQLADLLIQEKN